MTSRRLRVATYNVHGCRGLDRRCSPPRIGEVLRALEADVVALQEVESRPARSRFDQFEALARATAMTPVADPQILAPEGQYGNVLLSRLPILRVRRLDLSQPGVEPRGAIDVLLQASADVQMRIIATHLGRRAWERAAQIDALLAYVGPAEAEAGPTLLLGDFNEWWPNSLRLRRLERRFPACCRPCSFPALAPALALDRIWASGVRCLERRPGRLSVACRLASDHLPVVADLQL